MFELLKILFRSDNLLTEAFNTTSTMLEEDFNMFDKAVQALRRSDSKELGFDIYKADKKINKFEREVRRKVMAYLAVAQPKDTSAGLTLITIVTDVERIGDYTKNIYELATAYPPRLVAGKFEKDLAEFEQVITERFGKVTKAYSESDTELAAIVMQEHSKISKWCDIVVNEMISKPPDEFTIPQAITLTLYIRHLKRISSHLTNIVSSVVNPFPRKGYRNKEINNGRA